ncbi:hypothetical protein C8R43DRAFT_941046 [Mycena crocata]|nr:hypothetical protein C8R43DRAFT_941046 [Mycena crocata]
MFSRLLTLGLCVFTLVAAVPTQQAVISCAVGQSESAIVLSAIDNSTPLEPGIYRILNGAAGALKATSPYGANDDEAECQWRVESTGGDMYRFVNMRFTEPVHYICSGGGHNVKVRDEFEGLLWTTADLNVTDSLVPAFPYIRLRGAAGSPAQLWEFKRVDTSNDLF